VACGSISAGPSLTFGFEYPKKVKALAVPTDKSIRFYNSESLLPRMPNSEKQKTQKPYPSFEFSAACSLPEKDNFSFVNSMQIPR
jgi:hypothetical protein